MILVHVNYLINNDSRQPNTNNIKHTKVNKISRTSSYMFDEAECK